MNNQIYIEDMSFFQDSSNKDLKLVTNSTSDRYTSCFFENNFDLTYDESPNKWNSEPIKSLDKNQIFTAQKDSKEKDDTSSNLADTEEHVHHEAIKKISQTENKELNTDENTIDSSIIKFNQRDVDDLLDMISKPNTDMNALLSEVLTAGPTDPSVKRKRAITSKVKGKRTRKTKEQLEVLNKEYSHNPDWSAEDIAEISAKLSLTKKQVYKWFWDQKINNGESKPKAF